MVPEELTRPFPETNFTRWELVRSEVALRREIDNLPGEPGVWNNIEWLVYNILQPIRDRFGPIRVNSGYRCGELNRAVGGSNTSLHLMGHAADIEPLTEGVGLFEVLEWAFENTPFSELIAEHFPGGWVHIAGSREFAETGGKGTLKLKDESHNYARLTMEKLADILGEGRRLA